MSAILLPTITSGITPNGRRTTVTNNILRNVSGAGIILSQSTEAEFEASGSIIVGNSIYNNRRYAIMIDAYSTKDVIISNNIINGVKEKTYAGINIGAGHQNIIVNSNIVHNCSGSGIVAHGTTAAKTTGVKISDNICYNNGVSLSPRDESRAGIRISADVSGSASDLNIENNFCFDDQTRKSQKYGIRLTNITNAVVRFNDLRNNRISGLSIVGDSGTILSENIA